MNNKELTKLVSYFAMGDGGLYRSRNEKGYLLNAKFIMNMKEANVDYIQWVKDTLEQITTCKIYNRKDYNTDGCNRQPQLRLESATNPFFTTIQDRIYCSDGHKGLDMHTLKLLDWEAMAILFMCDGSTCQRMRLDIGLKKPEVTVTLNMKRLSEAEQVMLKKTIKENLSVEFNVNKAQKYFTLRLRQKDIDTFMDGIEPYMKDSFKYKIIRTRDPLRG